MTDAYGLAYMAAKNIIGPVSIALFYVLLKYGVDVRGALAFFGAGPAGSTAAAAGKTAGALALASWVSTLFFPLVVLGAGYIGPKMGRGAGVGQTRGSARWRGSRAPGGCRVTTKLRETRGRGERNSLFLVKGLTA
jgi:hypothetical protein